ncbi:hypothetical protein PR202_ga08424 [Eleusine coracana subsp. coracana]|uniref:DUF3444 domain-containing protein n=1 Tax=Eleusine coracana subsp. coracana TaxID=191504 RepID=A0AAV5C0K4_ELECO|nr:hypothetical protein PR202_ga08424 [Eleusine coracana subsp. coracana]
MDPCFHGDNDELLSPDNNPIDKKKKSVCDTDVHCVSPSQVEFDGCIADLSDAKENGQCSSKQYDYHNFQDDRAIECFAVGQVWAAYDWDKFPRRYALITEFQKTGQTRNTLACAVPLTRLPGFHSDTNGSSEAAVSQFSNLSSSNMDLGAPQQGMMYYNNKFSPEDFREGQIWAVFDSRDRMPRSYVRIIHMVSCTSVFVLKLEPHPMLIEEIRWVEDGLPVACGVFRAGTETTYKDIWEFSHPVECNWSAKRSFYKIFPKKGEIWTMYKNWNITLNSSDIDKCEPRMVEILSDYSDENGVNACRLARINGCLTFFHRVLMEGFHLTKWISRSEMLSFSHRVPAFIVIEIKDHSIPKGTWHLEPNALPTKIIN